MWKLRPASSWQSRLRLHGVPLLLAAGLCTGIVATGSGTAAQDVPVPEAVQAQNINPNPLSAIDPASLTGFRDRPLFSPSRTRPPDPVTEPVSEAAEPPTEQPSEPITLQLLGVIGTPEGVSALVRDESDDTRHVLRTGDLFRGWSVLSVDGRELVLDKDGETMRLPTFKPSEQVLDDETPNGDTQLMPDLEGSAATP
ncbi:general secretion pathway protein N [Rhizobium sp. 9140]|nr:general secretion pathway protein N [Rhizobium sp. 9140]